MTTAEHDTTTAVAQRRLLEAIAAVDARASFPDPLTALADGALASAHVFAGSQFPEVGQVYACLAELILTVRRDFHPHHKEH